MHHERLPGIYLYRRIVRAKMFIDEHFSEISDLKHIADEACLSKFHFIRVYKAIYHKTPHQYLISVRIDKAQLLLKQGLSVTEVCFAVGFDSTSSFSALFKKLTNYSPSTYQVNELKRKTQMLNEPLKFIPNCFLEQKSA